MCVCVCVCVYLSMSKLINPSLCAILIECPTGKEKKNMRNLTVTQIRVPSAARFFLPESTFSADSLTVSAQPLVSNHTHQNLRRLKIPNTGSHTTVWTHEHTAHTDRNWVPLFLRLLCLTQVRRPKFSSRDKEVVNKCLPSI